MPFDAPHGVNVAECIELADVIERVPPERFDISVMNCGTVACVLGWHRIMRGYVDEPGSDEIFERALGISSGQRWALTMPSGWFKSPFKDSSFIHIPRTNAQAARVLRHLAATGEVDWGVAGEP